MAAGDPTGDDLCVGTINGNDLPVFGYAPETRQITFGSSVELTEGVKYAIVVRALDVGHDDRALWLVDLSGDYATGSKYSSTDGGSSWSETASQDFWFETLEGVYLRDSNTYMSENAGSSFYGSNWQVQTFTATSTYSISSVKLKLWRDDAEAAPGTITVSIKAVTPPGKAQNPTPADDQKDIKITGKDQLKKLQWEAPV